MLHFLGLLFIIVIAVLFIGLSIVGMILKGVFGIGRRSSASAQANNGQPFGNAFNDTGYDGTGNDNTRYRNESDGSVRITRPERKKKVFANDEGDYVEFEEVTD